MDGRCVPGGRPGDDRRSAPESPLARLHPGETADQNGRSGRRQAWLLLFSDTRCALCCKACIAR